jgi:TolA-binding protein
MNRIYRLFTLFILFPAAAVSVFADQSSSALDDKTSVDSAANAQVQIPAVPSAASAGSTDTTYLYDLKKLIDKARENIKEVNEKIKEQAVLKRNQAREERAREYYEKGVELTNEGKLDEAREYFEKAIRITEHPEMAGYIKESQRRLRKQENALEDQERAHKNQIKEDESTRKEDVEEAYKEAVDLYKQKKYHPAKDAFEHVDEIAPGYRATDS